MGKSQPVQPQVTNTLPAQLQPLQNDVQAYLQKRLAQPTMNPYQAQTLQGFFGDPNSQGFLDQGTGFLGGLLTGQLPPSIMEAAQKNLAIGQQGLNSELQKRGAFYSTHGLGLQQDLAQNATRDLNNMVFQNALGAIPQGAQLFGLGAGIGEIPNQLNPAIGASTNLLGSSRGAVTQPQYAPDPFVQILGAALPFFF